MKAKIWVLKKKISGVPSLDHFACVDEDLPDCGEGDIIVKAEYLSVDPYMRYRLRSTPVNATPPGSQVARVIESKNEEYPVGCHVIGHPGWRTHTHVTKERLQSQDIERKFTKLPQFEAVSPSAALGVLGMPGNTAYFGFLELCQPKRGDTVLVNGAAGAVGSLVCQIAKIKGCEVVAFAGSDEKVAWLKALGVDHVFNYKTTNISKVLKVVAPAGIDCYFDNVGGSFSMEAVPRMAEFGRVAICGAIATYNDESMDRTDPPTLASPYHETTILLKQLRVEGFLVTRWADRWAEGVAQMARWLAQGKIQYKETVTEGFERMPRAFIGLFQGDNIGKAVVKA